MRELGATSRFVRLHISAQQRLGCGCSTIRVAQQAVRAGAGRHIPVQSGCALQPSQRLGVSMGLRGANRRHALELGAARAEQTAAWLNTHVFMPPAERAEWAHLVSHLVLWTL